MSGGFYCLVACMVEVQTVKLLNPISGLRLFVKPVVKLVREKHVNIPHQLNYLM